MQRNDEPNEDLREPRGESPGERPALEPIRERCVATTCGGILYDAAILRKPTDVLFEREHWARQGALTMFEGGRGSVALLHVAGRHERHRAEGGAATQAQELDPVAESADPGRVGGALTAAAVGASPAAEDWVLRHYRRGGWAAKLSEDRYAWLGARRTRSFVEWRLLAELHRRGLPVPRPVAARYARSLLTYRADLITERIPDMRTLAQILAEQPLSAAQWRALGSTIAAFHRAGVHHADLNANNVLCGPPWGEMRIALLDFDRGRIRARGRWEQAVLRRLRRSLEKLARARPGLSYTDADWRALLEGYAQAAGA